MDETTTETATTETTETAQPAAGAAAEKPNPFASPPPAATEQPAPETPSPKPGEADAKERTWQDILRRDKEVTDRATRLAAEARELEQLRQLPTLAKTDPLRAAQLLGMDQTALLDAMIAKKDGAPEAAQPSYQQLEQRLTAAERRAEQQAAQSDLNDQIRLELLSGGHEAELLSRAMRAPGNTVLRDIGTHLAESWNRSGSLDIGAAIKATEEKYTAQAMGLTEYLLGSTKVKGQLMKLLGASGNDQQPGQSNPPSPGTDTAPQTTKAPATLNNGLQKQSPTTTRQKMTLEQQREAFNEAIRAAWKAKHEKEG